MDKFAMMEAEMRADELDWELEMGGDDYRDVEPNICPDCGGIVELMFDNNYGADADGRRGIRIEWLECLKCGYQPE